MLNLQKYFVTYIISNMILFAMMNLQLRKSIILKIVVLITVGVIAIHLRFIIESIGDITSKYNNNEVLEMIHPIGGILSFSITSTYIINKVDKYIDTFNNDILFLHLGDIKYNLTSKDGDCSICLQPLFGNQTCIQLTNCIHTYHHKCINTWYTKCTQKTCPMCRKSLI